MRYLVTNAERVVSKDELLGALWPGEHVSESVLPRCITVARKALGDDPNAQRMIQTVHGRGYRFVGDVRRARSGARRRGRRRGGRARTRASSSDATRRWPSCDRRSRDAGRGRGRLAAARRRAGHRQDPHGGRARGRGARRGARSCSRAAATKGRARPRSGRGCRSCAERRDGVRADGARRRARTGGRGRRGARSRARGARRPSRPRPRRSRRSRRASASSTASRASSPTAARPQPIVLVLDDLHWADAPSLLLLQFLARQMRDARLLVLGAYRDVELRRQHPLAEVLGELAREPCCQRVALRGLAREDVEPLHRGHRRPERRAVARCAPSTR